MAWFDRSRKSSGGHPDEGKIHAWLNGALSREDAARVESHVMGCATCREAVAEARGFIAASSRILAALDAVPSGVLPVGSRTRERSRARSITSWPVRAIAAAVVLAVGVTVVARRAPVPNTVRAPAPVAAPSNSAQADARERAPLAGPPPATPSRPATPSQSAARSQPAARSQLATPSQPAAAKERMVPSRAADAAAPMAKTAAQGAVGGAVMKAAKEQPLVAEPRAAAPPVAATATGAAQLAALPCDTTVRKARSDSSSALRLEADSMAASDSGRDTALRAGRGCRGLPKR